MNVYELVKQYPESERKTLERNGVFKFNVNRYLLIYECFIECINKGEKKMDAYNTVGKKFFTSTENVIKIIRIMSKDVVW